MKLYITLHSYHLIILIIVYVIAMSTQSYSISLDKFQFDNSKFLLATASINCSWLKEENRYRIYVYLYVYTFAPNLIICLFCVDLWTTIFCISDVFVRKKFISILYVSWPFHFIAQLSRDIFSNIQITF